MGTLPPKIDLPSNLDSMVWRYMDFAKFVSMLHSSSLFVPRADLLGDPYEGTFTRKTKRYLQDLEKEHPFPEQYRDMRLPLVDYLTWSRQWTYISSWHMNEYESAAMWRLYALKGNAIALQSSYRLLAESLERTFLIGLVRYIDYDRDSIDEIGAWTPYFYKRKSFEHEKELRAVMIATPTVDGRHDIAKQQTESGLLIQVNLGALVERIYVDPSSPKWLTELVQNVANKYGLKKDVIQSSLDSEPPY